MATRPPSSNREAPRPNGEFIEAVEDHLRRRLRTTGAESSPILEEAASHLTLADAAKRARPRLVGHVGRELDLPEVELVPLAAAGELVHTASLLHDDVLDEGSRRRGRASVNTRWNNTVAILGGDLLLTASLDELRPYSRSLTDAAVDVVEQMTRALMLEAEARASLEMSFEQWREMATGKTGALFGWCMAAPALHAGKPPLAGRLRECGRRLGIAFQIADDLRDLVDPASGKDRYADLHNGTPSFVLLTAGELDPELARRLTRMWSRPADRIDLDPLVAAIADAGALQRARSALADELERAIEVLDDFRDCTGGRSIIRWARALGERFDADPPGPDPTASEEPER